MTRQIEVFVAGCSLCDAAVATVRETACSECDVTIHNMMESDAQEKARRYGVHAVPAVVVDGKLADCCARGPVSAELLRAAGVGRNE